MRPLRQPLECSLIDPALADKIFYKIPEILAHHQVNLNAYSKKNNTKFLLFYIRYYNAYKLRKYCF